MNSFTLNELNRLRSQPQSFQRRMAVFVPYIPWQGTISGSPSKGDRVVTVTTTDGDLADIITGTVCVIDPGINEQHIRVKSVDVNSITFEENNYSWEAGIILKNLLLFEPRSVRPRIVNDGDGHVTYFEDYDVPYSDQNETFRPVVCMGPAIFALELDCESSGTFSDLSLDASESFAYDASIASYQWGIIYGAAAPWDAEIVGSDTLVTSQFRFWETGDYYVYCTITADNGKVSTGYRAVIVRCNTPGHPNSPFYDFEIGDLSASRDAGYWSSKISIFEDCPQDKLPRNVPVVIYGNVVYGHGASRSTTPVPWHYSTPLDQRFVGWILSEQWTKEYIGKGAVVSFDAVGILGLIDERSGYSGWLNYKNNPNKWIYMKGLTSDRAVYFWLRNRTTLLNITDWHPAGATRLTRYAEIADGGAYGTLKDFLLGAELIELCSDRQSCLWSEFDGNYLNDASRISIVTDMFTVTDADHMNEIEIPTTRDQPEIAWLSIDGLQFDGSIDTPRIAWSPGYVYQQNGRGVDEISGLIIGNQSDLNVLAGRMFSVKNNPFKSVEMNSQGFPYDIAPQGSIHYDSLLSSGTFREEEIDEIDFLIRDVADKFTDNGGLISKLSMEAIIRDHDALVGSGVPKAEEGVEGMFPPEITGIDPGHFSNDWGGDLFDWQDFAVPDDAIENPIDLSDSAASYAYSLHAIGRRRKGESEYSLLYTAQGITGAPGGKIFVFRLHPHDPKNKAFVITETGLQTNPEIWEITNLNSDIPTITRIFSLFLSTGHDGYFAGEAYKLLEASINVNGLVYSLIVDYDSGVRAVKRAGENQSFSYDVIAGGVLWEFAMGHHASGPDNGVIYVINGGFNTYRSDDMGTTWTLEYNWGYLGHNSAIYVPFNDNINDDVAYFSNSLQQPDGVLRRSAGGVYTVITPFINGKYLSIFSPYAWDYDRNKMMTLSFNATDGYRILISEDAGDTWEVRNFPVGVNSGSWIKGWTYDSDVAFLTIGCNIYMTNNIHSGGPTGVIWTDITANYCANVENAAISEIAHVWVE